MRTCCRAKTMNRAMNGDMSISVRKKSLARQLHVTVTLLLDCRCTSWTDFRVPETSLVCDSASWRQQTAVLQCLSVCYVLHARSHCSTQSNQVSHNKMSQLTRRKIFPNGSISLHPLKEPGKDVNFRCAVYVRWTASRTATSKSRLKTFYSQRLSLNTDPNCLQRLWT